MVKWNKTLDFKNRTKENSPHAKKMLRRPALGLQIKSNDAGTKLFVALLTLLQLLSCRPEFLWVSQLLIGVGWEEVGGSSSCLAALALAGSWEGMDQLISSLPVSLGWPFLMWRLVWLPDFLAILHGSLALLIDMHFYLLLNVALSSKNVHLGTF